MKRRKIFLYRPGWISLLLLPLFCAFFLCETNTNKQYRLLKVFHITKESYTVQGDHAVMFFHPPERHFQKINIGAGNREEIRKQLDTARSALQEMVRTQDTIHGVHFHFEKQATHGVFVQILNLCKVVGADHFLTLENDVRVYFLVRDTAERQNYPLVGLFDCVAVAPPVRDETDARLEAVLQSETKTIFRQHLIDLWPSGLMFILLCFLYLFSTSKIPKGNICL